MLLLGGMVYYFLLFAKSQDVTFTIFTMETFFFTLSILLKYSTFSPKVLEFNISVSDILT